VNTGLVRLALLHGSDFFGTWTMGDKRGLIAVAQLKFKNVQTSDNSLMWLLQNKRWSKLELPFDIVAAMDYG
jgi:hypothetical protein